MTVRILIADDHEVVRKGLAMVLRLDPAFEIVGEARDGAEAVSRAEALCPDVALLDLKMPILAGDAAARQIRLRCPQTRIIILTGAEVDDAVFDVIEMVDGFVLKDISPDELSRAIRSVAAGERYVHSVVVERMKAEMGSAPDIRVSLSPREMEVLRQMATAATYREIGQKLFISEETVRSHAKNILAKLNQPNRTRAVVVAVKLGLITLD
ncbi:MAG: response regulator transcription factor [Chloroflexi bacterium]|nr:response regulator transcription factor [Chloroflexota bacterium]